MAIKKIVQTVVDKNDTLAAFLVEGQQEYVTKEEAIRLVQMNAIDAEIVRPKNKQPYIRERGNKTKKDNFRNLAVKHCGPEIGHHLRQALYACQRKIEKEWVLDFDALRRACRSLTELIPEEGVNATNAWDIVELYEGESRISREGGSPIETFLMDYVGCAKTPPCDKTVMVYGKCHKSGTTNFVLFGWLWYLCSRNAPLADFEIAPEIRERLMFMSDGEEFDRLRDIGRALTRVHYYSVENLESRVRSWKRIKSLKGSVNTEAAVQWALAGFNNWVNNPIAMTPVDDRFASCSRKCPKSVPDNFSFTVRWGGEEFDGK